MKLFGARDAPRTLKKGDGVVLASGALVPWVPTPWSSWGGGDRTPYTMGTPILMGRSPQRCALSPSHVIIAQRIYSPAGAAGTMPSTGTFPWARYPALGLVIPR